MKKQQARKRQRREGKMKNLNELPEVSFKFAYRIGKSAEQSAEDLINELNKVEDRR